MAIMQTKLAENEKYLFRHYMDLYIDMKNRNNDCMHDWSFPIKAANKLS